MEEKEGGGGVEAVEAKYIVPERVYIKISGSMDLSSTASTSY